MVLTKAKKQSIVAELASALRGVTVAVFVNFHGLSVAKSTKLRRTLRKSGASYQVVKKTLLRRALDTVGISGVPELRGEIGVVSSSGDVTESPRIVAQFIKEEKEGLAIVGGLYESRFVDESMIKYLSSIPSREMLLAQLAFVFTQPVASLARVLSEVAKTAENK